MVAAASELLGVGLYTPEEAALYARVSTRMLNRWLFGTVKNKPIMRSQLPSTEDYQLVTFLDFVQALAVRAVRLQYAIPLQRIRQALDKAKNEYNVPYPFAQLHTTYLVGNDLVIKLGTDEYVQASGKGAGNRMFSKVVELYMRDLGFDPTSGQATYYNAFRWKDYEIKMNPQVRLGEPLVTSCGCSARSLWEAVKSEGSIEAAAAAYGVKTEEVEAAYGYFDHILPVVSPRESKTETLV